MSYSPTHLDRILRSRFPDNLAVPPYVKTTTHFLSINKEITQLNQHVGDCIANVDSECMETNRKFGAVLYGDTGVVRSSVCNLDLMLCLSHSQENGIITYTDSILCEAYQA